MELKEALAEAQAKLAHLHHRRESVAAELARIDGELEQATADEAVLSRWAARDDGATVPDQSAVRALGTGSGKTRAIAEAQVTAEWRALPRMAAVERALYLADKPLSPTRIREYLHQQGRDDDANNVHAALGHLKAKNRAVQAERGLWLHPSKVSQEPANGATTKPTTNFTPAAGTAGVSETGGNGSPTQEQTFLPERAWPHSR